MAYAAVADVRTQGITVAQAADATVTDRLAVASMIIDNYTGWQEWDMPGALGAQFAKTVTVNDVRKPVVILPYPFASITSVTINGNVADPTTYTVEDWGLRLYVSGGLDYGIFPAWAMENQWYGSGGRRYGAQVQVAATFGYSATPVQVRHACVLITAFLCGQIGELPIDPRIQSLAVEGYQIRMIPHTADEILDTTGVVEADRLLQRYRLKPLVLA